jgi:hypothetical protein
VIVAAAAAVVNTMSQHPCHLHLLTLLLTLLLLLLFCHHR